MKKIITLAHGNGGEENNELIEKVFYKYFKNDILSKSEDSAIIEDGKLAFSTDSFTISPLFFSGGDIGKLAICGTCNDLAMMGAKPKYITCSVIIEEGFSFTSLDKIVKSMKNELEINQAIVVSGDTKVVPKGSVDKIFINTSGIGEVEYSGISASNIKEDMSILISRDIGTHGASVFALREGISLENNIISDCASLYPEIKALIQGGIKIISLRDATRGGLSSVLNEWAKSSDICIEIDEKSIPIKDEVRGICEMLGFEAFNLANEGTFTLVVETKDELKALDILQKKHKSSAIIGKTNNKYKQKVILNSSWGTKRFLDLPTGELLPRIC